MGSASAHRFRSLNRGRPARRISTLRDIKARNQDNLSFRTLQPSNPRLFTTRMHVINFHFVFGNGFSCFVDHRALELTDGRSRQPHVATSWPERPYHRLILKSKRPSTEPSPGIPLLFRMRPGRPRTLVTTPDFYAFFRKDRDSTVHEFLRSSSRADGSENSLTAIEHCCKK
jgi:hypothetical protein